MKRRLPRAAKIGLRLCFAAVVLGLLFREVPFSSVADSLGRADCRYLAPAFLMALLVHGLASARLVLLTRRQGIGLSGLEVFAVNTAVRFYGLFLPGDAIPGCQDDPRHFVYAGVTYAF